MRERRVRLHELKELRRSRHLRKLLANEAHHVLAQVRATQRVLVGELENLQTIVDGE